MVALFRELCSIDVTDDGLEFLELSVRGRRIREDQMYEAVRILLEARLAGARIPLQIDIGFGDAVHPVPVEVEYPTLLDLPAPRLSAYRMETVIAEKFEAMVSLGIGNSRMKDFYDIWILIRSFPFEATDLVEATSATFAKRQSTVPREAPLALTIAFADDPGKRTQWAAFVRKGRLQSAPPELNDVIEDLSAFFVPILAGTLPPTAAWPPGGPW